MHDFSVRGNEGNTPVNEAEKSYSLNKKCSVTYMLSFDVMTILVFKSVLDAI